MKKYVELVEMVISKIKMVKREEAVEIYKRICILFVPFVISIIGKQVFSSNLIIYSVLNVVFISTFITSGLILMFKLKHELSYLIKIGLICSLILNLLLSSYQLLQYIDIKINLATYNITTSTMKSVNIAIIKLLGLMSLYLLSIKITITHLKHKD